MPLPALFCKTIFILPYLFSLGVKNDASWKMMESESTFWSQTSIWFNPEIKLTLSFCLSIYLFTALATFLGFFPMFLPDVSYCHIFPMSSTLLGAPWTASSPFPSLLSNLRNDEFSHCVLKVIKCYLVRVLAGWGKKCDLKIKAKIQAISPGYVIPVTPQNKFFGRCLAGTCSTQLLLSRAMMTDVQKQEQSLEILGEDEELCRCQDPWNDVGPQADGNKGLSQQSGREFWTPCTGEVTLLQFGNLRSLRHISFWNIQSVPNIWVVTEVLIHGTSKHKSHVRSRKGPPRQNWKGNNMWEVTVWAGEVRTGLESLRPCSPVTCKTSLVFAWKQSALTFISTWESRVLLQTSRLLWNKSIFESSMHRGFIGCHLNSHSVYSPGFIRCKQIQNHSHLHDFMFCKCRCYRALAFLKN